MKILLVCEDIPAPKLGGLGKHVVALGNALLAQGHEVALMGKAAPSYADCATEVGFQGKFIPAFGNPLRGWKEEQMGFFNPLKRPYFAKRLAKAILTQAGNYDVIHYHGHQPMVGLYIPAAVSFVQTRHDQGGDCIINLRFRNGDACHDRSPITCAQCIHPAPGPIRTAISAKAVKQYRQHTVDSYSAHPVIFVSEFLRENFRKTMPMAQLEKSTVLHNFIDEELVAAIRTTAAKGIPESGIRIHIAGRLDEAKGIRQFLDLLVPKLPHGWSIDVFGDGPLKQQIAATHQSNAVKLHGHSPQQQTLLSAASATVVVVPSLLEEAFGLVTLEALRVGKMCFALARGGTTELQTYGAPGQLRLFNDLPALVDGLLTTGDFQVAMGGASSALDLHITKLLSIYRRDQNAF